MIWLIAHLISLYGTYCSLLGLFMIVALPIGFAWILIAAIFRLPLPAWIVWAFYKPPKGDGKR